MEFRANDHHRGQIRVYVLADDIGHAVVDRGNISLRKDIARLLARLDVSSNTWNGKWDLESQIHHMDSTLNTANVEDPSLFELFNTLPSPKPEPELVTDPYAKQAMDRILEGQIDGLKTKMHYYQRRSAALMLQRESKPAQALDPRLRHLTDQSGKSWYCDIGGGYCYREPRTYEAPRGGICAETMGLGKTLICLGLIMATRDCTSQIPPEYTYDSTPVRKKTGSLIESKEQPCPVLCSLNAAETTNLWRLCTKYEVTLEMGSRDHADCFAVSASTIGRKAVPWRASLAILEGREHTEFYRCREALARNPGFYSV